MDTWAIDCAINEQTELTIDKANSGMRSRSTGNSGAVRLSCRITSRKPDTAATTSSSATWIHAVAMAEALKSPNSNVPNATACNNALTMSNLMPDSGVSGRVRIAMTARQDPAAR